MVPAMSSAGRPVACGATMVSSAVRTAGMQLYPKLSPQPTIPSSVSTRTSRQARVFQVSPPKPLGGPAWVKGTSTVTASTDAIFMRCPSVH